MTVALTILGIFPESSIIVVVILFGIYAFFSGGPGILQWLYPNELFPTEIRASAVGAAMAFSRIGTVITMYGLPAFLATSGIGATMLVGVGVSIVGFFVSILFAPETKGLTLAESSSLPLWYRRVKP
jgi:putative MFS transporter